MQISAMEYVLDNIRVNVHIPLGVSMTETVSKKIELYPNPVSDILYMQIENIEYEKVHLAISNTLGQSIFSTVHRKSLSPLEINTHNFAKGIYFINVQIDDLPVISKKIILQ